MKKSTLIEIIIAGLLLVGELISVLVYRFSGFIVNLYRFDTSIMGLGELLTFRLLAIFADVDVLYAIVVLLIHSKGERNKRIFEIFVAALLFVVETIVLLYYCRLNEDGLTAWELGYFVRLLVVYVHMNILYIIAILIINSQNFKLCKTVFAVLLALIAFITIWLCLLNMHVGADEDGARNYMSFLTILTVFASIYAFYAVGLAVSDFICGKLLKKNNVDATATAPVVD